MMSVVPIRTCSGPEKLALRISSICLPLGDCQCKQSLMQRFLSGVDRDDGGGFADMQGS